MAIRRKSAKYISTTPLASVSLLDGPRSYLKYLVCNKEATDDNTNAKECVFGKNYSTQSG